MENNSSRKRFALIVLFSLLLALMLCYFARTQITGLANGPDASQNMAAAYNFAKYNEISYVKGNPTSYREPVTPLVAGIWMKLNPAIDLDLPLEKFAEGSLTRLVKLSNLFWLFLLLFASFWSAYNITGNLKVSTISILAVWCFLSRNLNHLLTEIPTAALLILFSCSLVRIYKKNNVASYLSAGAFGGGLALTRAVFFYIVPVVFLLVFILMRSSNLLLIARRMLMAALCFSLFVFPWMLRNYYNAGHFSVALRGGKVLYERALKNTMSLKEFKGAFYDWAPTGKYEIGRVLGFSAKDFREEGVFKRLNRKLPVSFHKMAGAERNRLFYFYEGKGRNDSDYLADKHLQKNALKMIFSSPFRHLMMTPLFFWRGIPEARLIPTISRHLPLVDALPLRFGLTFFFFGVVFLCYLKKHSETLLFSLPATAMIIFYSLFSHNIPRYNEPTVPIMIVSVIVACTVFRVRITLKDKYRLDEKTKT